MIFSNIPIIGDLLDKFVFTYKAKRKSAGIPLSYLEVDTIIKRYFPLAYCVRLLDTTCESIDKKEVLRLVTNYCKVNKELYIEEYHDCDDYAFGLNGFFCQKDLSSSCFGVMLSNSHAYNFFIDSSKELWLFEPQTSKAFKPLDVLPNDSYNTIQYIV